MLLAQQDLSEPQVRQHLIRFQKKQYEHLRKKLSLRIADSCYIFGIVDEYGLLGPDEVYINLPGRSGVLVRDVIVGRYVLFSLEKSLWLRSRVSNPSYHPGGKQHVARCETGA